MARWALIINGAVVTVVEQASQPTVDLGGEWRDITGLHVGPGMRFNGTQYSQPEVVRTLPPAEFWRRFSQAEREGLAGILATGTQAQKNKLSAFRDYVLIGGHVELDDDYIVASLSLMEQAGVIGTGRAAAILEAA